MNAGALLLGGCDALIGFLRKEITTELMKSVCFRSTSAGYTQAIPVATNFRDPRRAMPSSSTVVSKIVLFCLPFGAAAGLLPHPEMDAAAPTLCGLLYGEGDYARFRQTAASR